jgi:hypothetical protein
LENPKRLFKILGTLKKIFPKKKVPVKKDHVDASQKFGWHPSKASHNCEGREMVQLKL